MRLSVKLITPSYYYYYYNLPTSEIERNQQSLPKPTKSPPKPTKSPQTRLSVKLITPSYYYYYLPTSKIKTNKVSPKTNKVSPNDVILLIEIGEYDLNTLREPLYK